jgi:hypothetical protein
LIPNISRLAANRKTALNVIIQSRDGGRVAFSPIFINVNITKTEAIGMKTSKNMDLSYCRLHFSCFFIK